MGTARAAARQKPLIPRYDGCGPDISALSGKERDQAFELLIALESDRHPLHDDWHGDAGVQLRYTEVFLPSAQRLSKPEAKEFLFREFTTADIATLARHKRIALDDDGNGLVTIGPLNGRHQGNPWPSEEAAGRRSYKGNRREKAHYALLLIANLMYLRGESITYWRMCWIVNHNREAFGITECQWMTQKVCGDIMREAGLGVESDRKLILSHTYFRGHRYAYVPAVHSYSPAELDECFAYFGINCTSRDNDITGTVRSTAFGFIIEALDAWVNPYHKRYWNTTLKRRRAAEALAGTVTGPP